LAEGISKQFYLSSQYANPTSKWVKDELHFEDLLLSVQKLGGSCFRDNT